MIRTEYGNDCLPELTSYECALTEQQRLCRAAIAFDRITVAGRSSAYYVLCLRFRKRDDVIRFEGNFCDLLFHDSPAGAMFDLLFMPTLLTGFRPPRIKRYGLRGA